MDGVINGQADAAFTSSISGKAYQLAKSPRGIVYPVISHKDKAGWERMNATAPFFFPFMGAEGADLDKDNKVESASYPYPILMTYDKQDANSGLCDDQGDGRDLSPTTRTPHRATSAGRSSGRTSPG